MPRHQLMTRLARYFQVLWVEPAESWRVAWRRHRVERGALNPEVPQIPSFRLMRADRSAPLVHRPRFAHRFMQRLRVRQAIDTLRAAGAKRLVLYLWRPDFDYALEVLPGALSCYHVDDEYTFATDEQPTSPREARLLGRVDVAIFHSPALWEKKAHLTPHPFSVPNGVDFRAFSTPRPEPADLAAVPHPRIGYVGVVKRFLDIPLLHDIALRRPDWSIVLVGPVHPLGVDAEPFERLSKLPNVHVLGAKAISELPAYAQHLDVGALPYDIDGYTKFIYPLKLHEYLAAGIPVVGSPIRTLQDFEPTISLATTLEEWCDAVTAALGAEVREPARVAERQAVAEVHDWDALAHRVALILADALGPEFRQKLEGADPDPAEPALQKT